jgi:hypothetical protein
VLKTVIVDATHQRAIFAAGLQTRSVRIDVGSLFDTQDVRFARITEA